MEIGNLKIAETMGKIARRMGGNSGPATEGHGNVAVEAVAEERTRSVFDISDLVQFWRDNVRPTGIQRVQIEVLKAVIEADEKGSDSFAAICFDPASHNWQVIPNDHLHALIIKSYSVNTGIDEWVIQLQAVLAQATHYVPKRGDALINLGSSWWIPDYLHKVRRLKAEHGVRYVPFIHDTIPLSVPQYCDKNLVSEFRLWFRGAVGLADHVIVNSECSKRDVLKWANDLTGSCAPVSVARLNAAFPKPEASATLIVERLNLDGERFVICVGTLEARKNHALLFRVWSELLNKLPAEKVPKLVLVGKKGWKFDLAQATLASDPRLEDVVTMVSNLSDEELAELYRKSLFTIFPSFYEGWGLPVTEATSYGKLTLASSISSLPEAASQGDILLDPADQNVWTSTLLKLLADDDSLEKATGKSIAGARLRRWSDIAGDIVRISGESTSRGIGEDCPEILDGMIYDFRIETAQAAYERSALPFRRGSGWHQLEDWGTWSAPGATELRFKTRNSSARFLYLVVRGAQTAQAVTIVVDKEKRAKPVIPAQERVILRVDLGSTDRKEHVVRIVQPTVTDLNVMTGGADKRKVGIGILNMACIPAEDFGSRLNFLETMQMFFV